MGKASSLPKAALQRGPVAGCAIVGARPHPRQTLALAPRRDVRQPRLTNLKHLPIKESRCALRWVPDLGRHLAGYREMRQEHFDLGRA